MISSATIDATLIPPVDACPAYARVGDFARAGAARLNAAIQRGLEPNHRVLDLGCGVGRFAVAFEAFAGSDASYEGVDVSPESIETCNTYIRPRAERFNFQVADVFSSEFRRDADAPASTYRFPFPDGSFDFVFSASLFTHLTRKDLEHYLREIGRVLAREGRTLNTFFLLNAVSRAEIEAHSPRIASRHFGSPPLPHTIDGGVARVRHLDRPEAVIAYEEDFVRQAHARAHLRIEEPVRYGGWCGRDASGPGFGSQDIIAAVRA